MSELTVDISESNKWMIILALGLINGIELSNRTSLNVLLPDMQGNVAANSDEISWVLILYNIGFLCSLALSRWMTKLFGSRNFLLGCILFYSIGALGCFSSGHNLDMLLLSRLIMGFGGGAFLVRAVVISIALFPGNLRRVPWSVFLILAFSLQVIYPPIFGAIADNLHWNFAFLLDFPFLLTGAAILWSCMPPGRLRRHDPRERPDLAGASLLIAGLAASQLALSRGERDLWFQSPWISGLAVTGVFCFVLFVWWDSRPEQQHPVLHLRTIWRTKSLRASFFLVALMGALLGTGLFVIPQYLRNVQNYSATQTGFFFSVYAAGLATGLVLSLRALLPRLGPARSAVAGFSALGLTYMAFVYVFTPDTPGGLMAAILCLQGLCTGPIIYSAAGLALGQVQLPDLPESDTVVFFVRQLGITAGITAATIVVDRRMTFHSARILDQANRLEPLVRSTLSEFARVIERRGGPASSPQLGAIQLFQADVVKQAQLLSFIDIYFCLAVLCGIGLALVLVMRLRATRSGSRLHFTFQ